MSDRHHKNKIHLLALLPKAERARMASHLVLVDMPLGHVAYESRNRPNHVYFPTTCIVSLLYVLEEVLVQIGSSDGLK